MTAPSREALEARLAELNRDIAAYSHWGAKLTAMDEERKGIEAQLAALPEQPTPDAQPEEPFGKLVLLMLVFILGFVAGQWWSHHVHFWDF